MFQDLCSYVIQDFVFRTDELGTKHPALSLGNLLVLEDAGLVYADSSLGMNFEFDESNQQHLSYQNWLLRVSAKEAKTSIGFPAYILTPSGRDLYGFAERTHRMDYLGSLSRFLHSNNCKLFFWSNRQRIPRRKR